MFTVETGITACVYVTFSESDNAHFDIPLERLEEEYIYTREDGEINGEDAYYCMRANHPHTVAPLVTSKHHIYKHCI